MKVTDLNLIRRIDRVITNRVLTSEATHPIVPVKQVAAEIAASASDESDAEVLQLVCERAISRGYVLGFGEQP
ncbi:MAG TPA: hypothetical protein VGN79_13080 [Devosia sp.]|jgi:hypothetical protein|nr:hypothetical protein [Devosia sp.]